MKVALVHDYLNAYGGAERVLQVLARMYPEAPIYTAFVVKGSPAWEQFKDRKIVESWAAKIPGFRNKLHSPLRWLIPLVWEKFNLDDYDMVISSSAAYMCKAVITRPETLHVCYCHTPPRFLYGYDTAGNYGRFALVRAYANWVSKHLREFDFVSAQRVDVFIANSKNVARRIDKFYRRESVVVYPPVEVSGQGSGINLSQIGINGQGGRDYFLTGGRLVRGKNFDLVIKAANELGVKLKVYGDGPLRSELQLLAGKTVEFLGRVNEAELAELYAGAKAFVAIAEDEDFGITPVEAMAHGCPVLAYRGGGYVETVVEGETGLFVDELTVEAVVEGMKKVEGFRFKVSDLKRHAERFGRKRFEREIRDVVEREWERIIK